MDNLETCVGGKELIALMHLVCKPGARIVKGYTCEYEKGVLKPLEPVELHEGEEVIVSVERKIAHGLAELVESLRKETPKVDNPERLLEEMRK